MIIDERHIRFFKAAQVVCSKSSVNKVAGIMYNGQSMYVANDNVQLIYTSDEPKCESMYLPIKAIEYISSFEKGSRVNFDKDGNTCKINCGRSNTKFALLTPEALPTIGEAKIDNVKEIQLPPKSISILKKVNTAPTNKVNKPMARGIKITSDSSNIVAFGTDGTKLAYAIIAKNIIQNVNVNLDKDILSLILSSGLFDNGAKIISADNNRKLLLVSNDNIKLIVPQNDFTALDAKSLINTVDKTQKSLELSKTKLLSICRRADMLNEKRNKLSTVAKMTIAKEEMMIQLRGAITSYSDIIQIKNYRYDEDVEIGIDINMLITALQCMNSDRVLIHYGGSLSAYYLTDGVMYYLLMPVRIGNIS